jgi:GTP-binding protein
MKIVSAEFVTGAVKPEQYPAPELPEIAFAGRSNVGKSSLINTLVNRKRLVKTSNTPGRTQQINFFRVNGSLHLVDLPGYGFAKVPPAVKRQWGPMVETYLSQRPNLKAVVLILDVRRNPGAEDDRLFHWLGRQVIPVRLVVTKIDKLGTNRRLDRLAAIGAHFAHQPWAPIPFSARTRFGREALWAALLALIGAPPS